MEDKDSIYDEEGRIKKPDVAQEIANLEAPVKNREKELERQAKEGLTEEEVKNLALMKSLEEKYPLALLKSMSPDGKDVWRIKAGAEFYGIPHFDYADWYITQEGIFGVHTTDKQQLEFRENPGKIFSRINNLRDNNKFESSKDRNWAGFSHYKSETEGIYFFKIDIFGCPQSLRQRFGEMLSNSQKIGEVEQGKIEEARKLTDLSQVLNDITSGAK